MSSEDRYPGLFRVVPSECIVGSLPWQKEKDRRRARIVLPDRNLRQKPLEYLEWDGIARCRTLGEALIRRCVPEVKRILLANRPEDDRLLEGMYKRNLKSTYRFFSSYGDVDFVDWLLKTHPNFTLDDEWMSEEHYFPSHSVIRLILRKYKDRLNGGRGLDNDPKLSLTVRDYPLALDFERAGIEVETDFSISKPIPMLVRWRAEGMRRLPDYPPSKPQPTPNDPEDPFSDPEPQLSSEGPMRPSFPDEPLRTSALFDYGHFVGAFKENPQHETGCYSQVVLQTGDVTLVQAMFEASRSSQRIRDELKNMWPEEPFPPEVMEYLCARASSGVAPEETQIVSRFISQFMPFPEEKRGVVMARLVPMALEAFRPIDLALVHRPRNVVRKGMTVFRVGSSTKPLEFLCRGSSSIQDGSSMYRYAKMDFNFVFRVAMESVRLLLRMHETDQGTPYKVPREETFKPIVEGDTFYGLVRRWFQPLMTHPNAPYEPSVEQEFEIEYDRLLESMVED